MSAETFITIPVVATFGDKQSIGELRILESALPPKPDFVFALGFQALEFDGVLPGEVPTIQYVGSYQLKEVAIQNDDNYIAYLRQIGKL